MIDIQAFAKQVEEDLIAVNPDWAEYPHGTESGILDQYNNLLGPGVIFYYVPELDSEGNYFKDVKLLAITSYADLPNGGATWNPDLGDGPNGPDGIVIEPPTEQANSGNTYFGDDPPEEPHNYTYWYETDELILYIWYDDGDTKQWVSLQCGAGAGGTGASHLYELLDVEINLTTLVGGEILMYDEVDQKWKQVHIDSSHNHDADYSAIDHNHDADYSAIDHNHDTDYLAIDGTAADSNLLCGKPCDYYLNYNNLQYAPGATDFDNRVPVIAFKAGMSTDQSVGPNPESSLVVPELIEADVEYYDTHGTYDTSTYKFTAPKDGVYQFSATFWQKSNGYYLGGTYIYLYIYVNGTDIEPLFGYQYSPRGSLNGSNVYVNGNIVLSLSAGDYVQLYIEHNQCGSLLCSANDLMAGGQNYSWWSGHYLGDNLTISSFLSSFGETPGTTSSQELAPNTYNKLTYNYTYFNNTNGGFDTSTSKFTVGSSGFYSFFFMDSLSALESQVTSGNVWLYVNGSPYIELDETRPYVGLYDYKRFHLHGQCVVYLNTGDYVELYERHVGSQTIYRTDEVDIAGTSSNKRWWAGVKIPYFGSYQRAFLVRNSAEQAITNGIGYFKIGFDSVVQNPGSHYDAYSKEYTVPESGYYYLFANVKMRMSSGVDDLDDVYLRIYINDSAGPFLTRWAWTSSTVNVSHKGGACLYLSKGQKVNVRYYAEAYGNYIPEHDGSIIASYFGGYLVESSEYLKEKSSSAYKSSAQTVVTGYTKITWQAVDYDIDDNFDVANNEFVVPHDGRYHVTAGLGASVTQGAYIQTCIYINGVRMAEGSASRTDSVVPYQSVVSRTFNVSAGDKISIYVYLNGNASTDVTATQSRTWFTISTIGGSIGQGVPDGGSSGQMLVKNSDTPYDTKWIDSPTAGGSIAGGSAGQILVKNSGTDGDWSWLSNYLFKNDTYDYAPSNGDIMVYNSTQAIWESKQSLPTLTVSSVLSAYSIVLTNTETTDHSNTSGLLAYDLNVTGTFSEFTDGSALIQYSSEDGWMAYYNTENSQYCTAEWAELTIGGSSVVKAADSINKLSDVNTQFATKNLHDRLEWNGSTEWRHTTGYGNSYGWNITESVTGQTCTTIIPLDTSIPQNNEGDQVLTVTYTPIYTNTSLLIEAVVNVSCDTAGVTSIMGLFRDTNADAIDVVAEKHDTAGNRTLRINKIIPSSATVATTLKLRVGPSSTANVYVNSDTNGIELFGGRFYSYLKITEVYL